jgi:hypothetical protein
MKRVLALVRWKIAWWRWFWSMPFRPGDPLLGQGDVRKKNREILWDRYCAAEPKRPK